MIAKSGFHEAVDRAKADGEKGDLGLLAAEAEGFEWESQGLRIVGRAQYIIEAYRGAAATWEALRQIDPLDLEANTLLGTIYQRLGDLTLSDLALQRALDHKKMEYQFMGRTFRLVEEGGGPIQEILV